MSAEILTRWSKKTPHSLVGTVPIVTQILLLEKYCDKEDPIHYLKPEERKSDNMLHLRNKAKLLHNSKKYFVSGMNFLIFLFLLKIHSHHQELWTLPGQFLVLVP